MKAGRWWKIVLIGSLVLNLCFVVGSGYIFYRKGGMRYLRNYRAIVRGDGVTVENFPTYYRQRYSSFWADPVRTGVVVLAGDSLTEQHDWVPVCGSLVMNRGVGADTTVGLLFRLPEILRHRPRKLFLLIGISDLRIGRTPDAILDTYDQLLRRIRQDAPETALFVQSLLPINPRLFGSEIDPQAVKRVNDGLRGLSKEHSATFVDVYSQLLAGEVLDPRYTTEGVHLNPIGYSRWAEVLRQVDCR